MKQQQIATKLNLKIKYICFFMVTLLLWVTIPAFSASPRWEADIEGGIVIPGYNDVQIPNNTGTRFSIKNDLQIEKKAYYRLRLTWKISDRHALSLLYAPLSLDANGTLKDAVDFEGVRFPANSTVDALYRFNSYRLTYRYQLINRPKLHLWIGFTAKIRDAEIKLTGETLASSKTNVGFVPLLHLSGEWLWNSRLGLLFEMDALAAKQGRAEDVSLALRYRLADAFDFKVGGRIVEGGADVESVYNFALISYLYAGILIRF